MSDSVLIDSDVAQIYRVETKRINEAVRNNPEKLPDGYILEPDKSEVGLVEAKFSTSINSAATGGTLACEDSCVTSRQPHSIVAMDCGRG